MPSSGAAQSPRTRSGFFGLLNEFRGPRTRRARLDAMLSAIPALAFDDFAAKTYGPIASARG